MEALERILNESLNDLKTKGTFKAKKH